MSYQGWWDHKERIILYFIPETMTGCKPHILLLLSAFLNGFKLKEFAFLKNRPLSCLAGCSLSSPSQDPARKGSPSAVPSSPWWRAEDDRCFSQVLQSVSSTHSQERRTWPSPNRGGFLQGKWAVLAQECLRQHEERPPQGQKKKQLLGGQFRRVCQAPPTPQGRTACLPARDSPCGAQATTDRLGTACSQEPLNPRGYPTMPGPGPAEGSKWVCSCCCLDLQPWYPYTAISFLYPLSYCFLTSSLSCEMKDIFI